MAIEPREVTDRRALYPIAIIEDRYDGSYSGGSWLAIANSDMDETFVYEGNFVMTTRVLLMLQDGPHGDDPTVRAFWDSPPRWIAAGKTPDAALRNLLQKYGLC